MKSCQFQANTPSISTLLRPAATLILLREARQSFEVLLLQRTNKMAFAGGFWVFPGGKAENVDIKNAAVSNSSASIDRLPAGELSIEAYRHAAIRETQEECAITVDADSLIDYSQWTTPTFEARRFYTWFFIVAVPNRYRIEIQRSEVQQYQWLTPRAALRQFEQGQVPLMPPTYLTLLELSNCDTIQSAMEFAHNRETPYYFPKVIPEDKPQMMLYTEDAGYESGDINAKGSQHRMLLSRQGYEYIKDIE